MYVYIEIFFVVMFEKIRYWKFKFLLVVDWWNKCGYIFKKKNDSIILDICLFIDLNENGRNLDD